MKNLKHLVSYPRPRVLLLGDVEHAELRPAVELLRETCSPTIAGGMRQAAAILNQAPGPELIVVAQSRSGGVQPHDLRQLEQLAPLAGIVRLLGSWCEGQARTARPADRTTRLYWYEFPPWWARQLARHRAGRCPDWARLEGARSQEVGARKNGLVLLSTSDWEAGAALSDALSQQGFATVWQRPGGWGLTACGATAGIWEGGQLDDREALRLAAFCTQLARDGAPVVALLDFPRLDRCRRALEAGAGAVLGKPWLTVDLVDAIQRISEAPSETDLTVSATRAA